MAQVVEYYSGGRKQRVTVQGVYSARQRTARSAGDPGPMRFGAKPQSEGSQVMRLLAAQPRSVLSRFAVVSESHDDDPAGRTGGRTAVIPTETVVVLGATKAELAWARREYGLTVAAGGQRRQGAARLCPRTRTTAWRSPRRRPGRSVERGNVEGAHPNFLRLVQRPGPAAGGEETQQWGLDNDG